MSEIARGSVARVSGPVVDVHFEEGVAKSAQPYLRKQILKNVLNSK